VTHRGLDPHVRGVVVVLPDHEDARIGENPSADEPRAVAQLDGEEMVTEEGVERFELVGSAS
jgi:hypothetical protein